MDFDEFEKNGGKPFPPKETPATSVYPPVYPHGQIQRIGYASTALLPEKTQTRYIDVDSDSHLGAVESDGKPRDWREAEILRDHFGFRIPRDNGGYFIPDYD